MFASLSKSLCRLWHDTEPEMSLWHDISNPNHEFSKNAAYSALVRMRNTGYCAAFTRLDPETTASPNPILRPTLEVVFEWSATAMDLALLAPVAVALSPIRLGRQAYSSFHSGMSNLQTSLSERCRRVKHGDNSRNRASLLPTEIQLQIFHLLRTRARFGAADFFVAPGEHMPGSRCRYPRASRDLAAARLVCQTWLDAATEVLYTDVVLFSLQHFLVFADTLVARPSLADSVKRITLPVNMRGLHKMRLAQLEEQVPDAAGAQWSDVQTALDHVFSRCIDVEDVVFFGGQEAVHDMMALLSSPTRLTHLPSFNDVWTLPDNPSQLYTFNITLAAFRLHALEALTLRSWALDVVRSLRTQGLLTLRFLSLENCALDRPVLMQLLSKLQNLRVFEWRRAVFNGFAACEVAAAELLVAHLPTLTSCTIHCPRPREYYSAVSITLDDMGSFSALRTLSVSGHMLQGLRRLPPCLVELDVIDFGPTGPGRHSQRAAVLESVSIVRYRARFWRKCSPSLRHIRLWDSDLARGQLRIWGIAAFLLRGFLGRLDVDLAVNLLLKPAEEEAFRRELGRREHIRRLLWKGVL